MQEQDARDALGFAASCYLPQKLNELSKNIRNVTPEHPDSSINT
jgi:hypothetical protein